MKSLVFATRNKGKLREVKRLLDTTEIAVRGLDDFNHLPEIVEDGTTFADNAKKKASKIGEILRIPCLADDSGLIVHALNGRPGVHSARFAGPDADDQRNNCRLLDEMAMIQQKDRHACFQCVMALYLPDEPLYVFEGKIEGMILAGEQGDGGFGYDPLFWVPEHNCTMAELPLELKNQISHRGQALRKVIEFLSHHPW